MIFNTVIAGSGGGSAGGSLYVVGSNVGTGMQSYFRISPVIASENDTVTVKYVSSSNMPYQPGTVLGITDVEGNTVAILDTDGVLTKNETWTFTMPGHDVALALINDL